VGSPLKLGFAFGRHPGSVAAARDAVSNARWLSDAVRHFIIAVIRHAVAAVSLDLQDAGVGSRRRGAGIRVPSRAPVSTGALAERRGVHLLELRVASLAHGEQATGLLVLTSYFLQSERIAN